MSDLFERLIDCSQEAFAHKRYHVAYHALAAALHCAREDESTDNLALVKQMALQQLAIIDRQSSDYTHSTTSAAKRGHVSIFRVLADQASVRQILTHHDHKKTEPGTDLLPDNGTKTK